MPRQLRQLQDNAIYHLMARGNAKEDIFREAKDYDRYLFYVQRAKIKMHVQVYSYVLMPNHVHFMMKTDKA